MATTLLKPTLHIEIQLSNKPSPAIADMICTGVVQALRSGYGILHVGQQFTGFAEDEVPEASSINFVAIADYTGPAELTAFHELHQVELDVQTYALLRDEPLPQSPTLGSSSPSDEDDVPKPRVLLLPSTALKDDWDSLIYDNALPSQLLRYLTRMLGVMKQPGLNLATFNWNRLCLLHGPPGSGKSTLCRALAQKLSIRLSNTFPRAVLVEVNTNSLLSKYFGESGKQIGALFDKIYLTAQASDTLVCVVMDEVETIAGSRQKASDSGECNDGMRATNQLLTALDRFRTLPNIIVMCTSNLIDAIDSAFLDRVDIKALIPSPSPEAIYNIFRSCLNELVRANLIDMAIARVSANSSSVASSSSPSNSNSAKRRAVFRTAESISSSRSRKMSNHADAALSPTASKTHDNIPNDHHSDEADLSSSSIHSSSPEKWAHITVPTIPTHAEFSVNYWNDKQSLGYRVWGLAQKCEGFSGRTLRRLPILGLAMYTWGGNCSLDDAVSALEAAVDQELKAKQKSASL